MADTKPITFLSACSKFFGKRPDQTLGEFGKELKELTKADREEMAPMLSEALGVPVKV